MDRAIKKAERFAVAGICLVLFCFALAGTARAADDPYSLHGEIVRNARESALYVAVTARPGKEGVYLYAGKSQTLGKPTEISVAVGGESLTGEALFPRGKEKADPWLSGAVTRVYEGEVTVYVPLPASARDKVVSVRMDGLACSAVNCTPFSIYLDIPALTGEPAVIDLPADTVLEAMPLFVDKRAQTTGPSLLGPGRGISGGVGESVPLPGAFLEKITPIPFAPHLEVSSLGKAIALGFLAGLILNLMPCILPVIGIKLAALFRMPGTEAERTRAFRRHQVFFSLGILIWFTCLAGLFHWLDLAWGQIFQSPFVVGGLAFVLLLLALSLFGFFHLPLIDFRAESTKNPDARAFFEGFTATLIATPCGGPLLGGVLSWALMQPLGILAVTLECVGLGMAFPYLLLAAFPALSRKLPRPGAWMISLEHGIGFLLLAAATYFVSFLPIGPAGKIVFAAALALFTGWMWMKRVPARFFGAACVIFSCLWLFKPGADGAVEWRDYSHAAFGDALGTRVVLVDFTADWCPTCKMVEATALRGTNTRAWEKEYGLAFFRVDLTRENPEGEALLKALGGVSIPVVAVFGKGESAYSPLVLRDIVTGGQVEEALSRIAP